MGYAVCVTLEIELGTLDFFLFVPSWFVNDTFHSFFFNCSFSKLSVHFQTILLVLYKMFSSCLPAPKQSGPPMSSKQLTQSKFKNKTRGEGDLATLRIGPRYRAQNKKFFLCNLASCRNIQKIHLFLFSKLA